MLKHFLLGAAASAMIVSAAAGQDAAAPKAAPAAKAAEKLPLLSVGSKAPSLEGIKFIKGEPVTGFESGQVYVLDFWATWCGPCVKAIPHINELQQKYASKGVNVIGLAVWPRPNMKATKDFVEAKGDKMSYRVAEDTADGKLAKNYMAAARQDGIPTIFVIDRAGDIAWIGNPYDPEFDTTIEKVVEGKWDTKAYAKLAGKRQSLETDLAAAESSKDHKRIIEISEEMLKFDAERYSNVKINRFMALANLGQTEKALSAGKEIIEKAGDDSQMLNMIAWTLVDPSPRNPIADKKPYVDLALDAAKKAAETTKNEDPAVLDTLARCYFTKGDVAKAIEVQTKAVELAPDGMKEDLTSSLEEYKTAKNKS